MAAGRKHQGDTERRLLGRRIRRRRLFMKKTQAALAKALGVTYQQLQKYENGLNRIPDARLDEIARLLGVSPGYFSGDGALVIARTADALEAFIESPEGVDLNRAMAALAPPARDRLILAVLAYCDGHAGLQTPEIEPLAAWLRKISDARGAAEIAADAESAIGAMKVELAKLLGKTLRTRKMTQLFAAQILRTDQARISTLSRGDIKGVSLEKLLRFLLLLGWDIHLGLGNRPVNQQGKVEITRPNS
jgi:transcriptional regulator with XRE-family HTH domain